MYKNQFNTSTSGFGGSYGKMKIIENLQEIVRPNKRETSDYIDWQNKTIHEFEVFKKNEEKEILRKNQQDNETQKN